MKNIRTRTSKYWQDRFERAAERGYDFGDDVLPRVDRIITETSKSINGKVLAFYGKYGTIESSPTFKTLKDGTEVVTGTSNKLVVTTTAANKPLTKGTRLDKLKKDIHEDLVFMSKAQNQAMKNQFTDLAYEAYYNTFYEIYRGIEVGTSFNVLSPTVVNQIIHNPVNGQDFSTRVWNNRDRLENVLDQTLTSGIIQGKSNGQMIKAISQNMNSARWVAKRLVQTEVTNTYNQATLQGYKDVGFVEKYEYLATLDSKTSEICTALDGRLFDVNKATVGVNYPPMHPNCRSTTVVHFDNSERALTRIARTLGGNTFTVPASMDAKNFKAIYVDRTLTRAEWNTGKRA